MVECDRDALRRHVQDAEVLTEDTKGLSERFVQGVNSVQINISTRHGHISEATRDKATEKLGKLSRFFDRISSIELIVDLEHREDPVVDLGVTAKQKEFVAKSQAGELMISIDQVVDKMEQQLRKYKEKVQSRHRNSGHRSPDTADELRPETS